MTQNSTTYIMCTTKSHYITKLHFPVTNIKYRPNTNTRNRLSQTVNVIFRVHGGQLVAPLAIFRPWVRVMDGGRIMYKVRFRARDGK